MEKELSIRKPNELTVDELERLKQIHIKLSSIVPSEANKIHIDLLYFDILHVLKSREDSVIYSSRIDELKKLHAIMSENINYKRRTSKNIVSAIKSFKNSTRILLRQLLKNEN